MKTISFLASTVLVLLLPGLPLAAQPLFVESGAARGIGPYTMANLMGGGIAAADFDDDGDVDFFIPNEEGVPDQLYRNLGNGFFEEIAAQAGLASTLRSRSALWFDADGDGDLDLVVASDCFGSHWNPEPGSSACEAGIPMLHLYRHDAGDTFTEITGPAGLAQDSGNFLVTDHRGGMAAGDLDGDGDLDLYVSLWDGHSSLYLNQGDGTFLDASLSSGIGVAKRKDWQPVMLDLNHDGRLDIFVSVDFGPNKLWLNQGDGTFVDGAPAAGVASSWNEMGVAVGDYDNDGDFDFYVTNVWQRSPGEHNVFFRNDSVGSSLAFTEVAASLGVDNTGWGWGTTFLDADLDGDLDLAVTNGFSETGFEHDASRFFQNGGAPAWSFTDISDAIGFNDTLWGSSLVCFDLNHDGLPDLVQTTKVHPAPGPLRLLLGSGVTGRHWVRIVPRMPAPNHQAIGAVVRARVGATVQSRLVTAGISFMGQEPAESFFGLGTATRVDQVVVEWPDGKLTKRSNLLVDRAHAVDWHEIFADGFESGSTTAWQ